MGGRRRRAPRRRRRATHPPAVACPPARLRAGFALQLPPPPLASRCSCLNLLFSLFTHDVSPAGTPPALLLTVAWPPPQACGVRKAARETDWARQEGGRRCVEPNLHRREGDCSGTKDMRQPCLLHLHLISLVPHLHRRESDSAARSSAPRRSAALKRLDAGRVASSLGCRCNPSRLGSSQLSTHRRASLAAVTANTRK